MYVLKRATRQDETAFDIGRDRVRGSRETRMSSGGGPGEVTEAQRARAAANKAAALAPVSYTHLTLPTIYSV